MPGGAMRLGQVPLEMVMLKNHQSAQEGSPLAESSLPALSPILDHLPCAVALWDPDRSFCLLNAEARRLLGVPGEGPSSPTPGPDRIHPQDRALVAAAWARLKRGAPKVSCDYRWFPVGAQHEIWLREVAVPYRNPQGEAQGILSVYLESAGRKVRQAEECKESSVTDEREILEGVVHALQNHLQGISMGLDLLRLTQADPLEGQTVGQGIERASRLLRELREYFFPPEPWYSIQSLAAVVTNVTQQIQQHWQRQGVQPQVVCRDPLPALRLDWQQVGKALERLLTCAYALLPAEGGEVRVEAGLREVEAQRYVELQVSSRGAIPLAVEGAEVFTPFLRVRGYQLGLSIVLVRQMVDRFQGQLTCRKLSPNQVCFTLLLRVP